MTAGRRWATLGTSGRRILAPPLAASRPGAAAAPGRVSRRRDHAPAAARIRLRRRPRIELRIAARAVRRGLPPRSELGVSESGPVAPQVVCATGSRADRRCEAGVRGRDPPDSTRGDLRGQSRAGNPRPATRDSPTPWRGTRARRPRTPPPRGLGRQSVAGEPFGKAAARRGSTGARRRVVDPAEGPLRVPHPQVAEGLDLPVG